MLQVAIGLLDGPAVGVECGDLGGRRSGAGTDEEVAVLVACGVANDAEQDWTRGGGVVRRRDQSKRSTIWPRMQTWSEVRAGSWMAASQRNRVITTVRGNS